MVNIAIDLSVGQARLLRFLADDDNREPPALRQAMYAALDRKGLIRRAHHGSRYEVTELGHLTITALEAEASP